MMHCGKSLSGVSQLVRADGARRSVYADAARPLSDDLATADAHVPRERLERAAVAHWEAAWPHVTGGDFVATHWLTSFALLR